MVKISIVVPIYNAEPYLAKCLDSIVGQTLRETEIILIDDGSTDGSAEICKQYCADSRVIYYRKENEGLAAARQDGIERASGEYIGFVDSDDWTEPDMYERMYAAAISNRADVVFCNCVENEDGHRFTPEMRSGVYDREAIIAEVLPRTLAYIGPRGEKRAIRWCNWLRLYRRAFLEEHGICFDRRLRRSQDLLFTYRAMLHAQHYYYMGGDYLYHNRVVADSLSRGYTKNMWPLYRMLIEDLYADTARFPELGLMDQMHLRTFFFATDCIENELKPQCPNDYETKLRKLSEIMEDPLCERFYGKIPTERLNPLLRQYYKLIVEKKPEKIVPVTKTYQKREARKTRYWKPFVHAITEGPVTGKLYKMIRGRFR